MHRAKTVQESPAVKAKSTTTKYPTMKEKLAKVAEFRRTHLERSSEAQCVILTPSAPIQAMSSAPAENVDTSQSQSAGPTIRTASAPRLQGFPPTATAVAETLPELYSTAKYYTNKLSGIVPSTLVSLFHALAQNLFANTSHKSAAAALDGSLNAKHQTLLEARHSFGFKHSPEISRKESTESPLDIRTVYRIFDLDPEITIYACCPIPSCSATYAPTFGKEAKYPSYPLRCTQTKFGKQCNTLLVGKDCTIVNGISIPRPIKPYPYHHFSDHIASMLSRPGIEESIRIHMINSSIQEELVDIMSSKALQNFCDSTGQQFVREVGTELRLVWALCADWYNPRTNKASGKSVSTGVLAMICLSLPPDIRYLEENIYLCGLIPGPKEPSVDATNHFLIPLMHDLAISYERGVYYSRTHEFPSGRISRSAIIPVIADTLASKKVTGHHGHSTTKYFCSRCRTIKDGICNVDPSSFDPALSRAEHEVQAERWLNARNKSVQDSLLKANGIRWSALLLLPYWQPSDWSITEGMHVLLLGVIRRHCRDLLGLNINDLPNEEIEEEPPSAEDMLFANRILEQKCPGKLRKLTMKVLKALCEEQGLVLKFASNRRRRKSDYIDALLGGNGSAESYTLDQNMEELYLGLSTLFIDSTETKSDFHSVPQQLPASSPPRMLGRQSIATIMTKQQLIKIREQIQATIRPTWQAKPPPAFGSPEHGKLKADEWRTLMEFDIPVSLIQLLADSSRALSGSIEDDVYLNKFVENTLDLAMALNWGLSRRTSDYHAKQYAFYMQRYLSGINYLYPDYNLKPIHHYALHIPDILDLFGPLHGTWAFSTERLIGRLQKFNTNSRIGEMEITVMKMFCRRSNLVQLVNSETCPTVLKEAWARFKSHLKFSTLERERPLSGGSLNGVGPPMTSIHRETTLDTDIQLQLLSEFKPKSPDNGPIFFNETKATILHAYDRNGVRFTDFYTHQAHSLVYYDDLSVDASKSGRNLHPAQIRQIFKHLHMNGNELINETYVAIHPFIPSNLGKEYFGRFADFRAGLFLQEPSQDVKVIKANRIHCHANQRPWDKATVVMRAIDRDY